MKMGKNKPRGRKEILELKSTKTAIKIFSERSKAIIEQTEERISKTEGRKMKIIESEEQKKIKLN